MPHRQPTFYPILNVPIASQIFNSKRFTLSTNISKTSASQNISETLAFAMHIASQSQHIWLLEFQI